MQQLDLNILYTVAGLIVTFHPAFSREHIFAQCSIRVLKKMSKAVRYQVQLTACSTSYITFILSTFILELAMMQLYLEAELCFTY